MAFNPFDPIQFGLRVATPPLVRLPVNNVLFISDRIDIIPAGEIKFYFTSASVQADFGLNSNEAQIANMYFGQGNLPRGYLIFTTTGDTDYIGSVNLNTPGSNLSGIPNYTIQGNGEGALLTLNGLVSLGVPSNFGTGYLVGDTVNPVGGTYSNPAIFEVTELQLVSSVLNAGGTDYAVNDTIIMSGGTSSIPVEIVVTGLSGVGISSINLITNGSFSGSMPIISFSGPGTGALAYLTASISSISGEVRGSGYLPGDTISPIGGTYTTQALFTVSSVRLSSYGSFDGGTGYAPGDLINLTGGTGTQVQITVATVDGGGAVLTGFGFSFGNYTVAPSTLTQGTTTGIGTGFQLNDCLYGIQVFSLTQLGNYTAIPTGTISYTTSGAGTGYTNILTWTSLEAIVTDPGAGYTSGSTVSFAGGTGTNPTGSIVLSELGSVGTYDVVNSGNFTVGNTALTQDTTSGIGSGLTLNTCIYGVLTLALVSGGEYTASAINPRTTTNIIGTGTGLTLNLNYILSSITVDDGGNGYDVDSSILFSGVTGTLPTATIVLGEGYATGFLAEAINTAYSLAQSQSIGGFSWVGFCDSAVSPFYGTITDAIDELNAIEAVCNNLSADMVIYIQTNDEDTLSSAPTNFLQTIQSQQYNSYMTVMISGIPNFSTDASNANKRLDALTFALQSSIQLSTYQTYLKRTLMYNQISLTNLSPVPVGATDNYGITYTQTYITSLVAGNPGTPGQLNMYTRNGQQLAYLMGYLANSSQNLFVNIQVIKIFIRQYLNQQLALLFRPTSGTPVVTYDNEGLDLVSGTIRTLLILISQSGMIQSGFTITNPTLNPNAPSPKIMGPFQLDMKTADFPVALTLDGVITTT